jgi:hypothetical protein
MQIEFYGGKYHMETIIGIIILGMLTVICLIISISQFWEKGFLFNNAYLYASKSERENMDKSPYYKQSAVVFLLLSIVFLLTTLQLIFEANWFFYIILAVVIATIIFAVVSSVKIEKRK